MPQGFQVLVLEQAAHIGEIGAGIQLGPNACHALGLRGIAATAPELVTVVWLAGPAAECGARDPLGVFQAECQGQRAAEAEADHCGACDTEAVPQLHDAITDGGEMPVFARDPGIEAQYVKVRKQASSLFGPEFCIVANTGNESQPRGIRWPADDIVPEWLALIGLLCWL